MFEVFRYRRSFARSYDEAISFEYYIAEVRLPRNDEESFLAMTREGSESAKLPFCCEIQLPAALLGNAIVAYS